MEKTVCFRDFEERDVDFIYKCKNDEKLNSMIVGQWHPFTYEEATKWVHGCMGEHDTYKFWAIATNDEEKRIVGWVGISEIGKKDGANFHSIVIGDADYRNGIAWIESFLFVLEFIFEQLNLNVMFGSALTVHTASMTIGEVMYETIDEIERNAVNKNGSYYDLAYMSLHSEEYYKHKLAGDYELSSVLNRFAGLLRKQKKNRL